MKLNFIYGLTLFLKTIAEVKLQVLDENTVTTSTARSIQNDTKSPTTTTFKSTPKPESTENGLNRTTEMSIEDILLSGIDANAKIEKDLVNMMTKYTSKYNSFKAVHFSTNDYLFEKKLIEFDLVKNEGKVSFSNFTVNSSYRDDHDNPKFTTIIQCDSEGNTTIHVVLPEIEITLNSKVTLAASQQPSHYGSISVILQNGTIIGQMIAKEANNNTIPDQIQFATISNQVSKFHIKMDSKYQALIHNNLQETIVEITHSLENFLTAQLNVQIQMFKDITSGCSTVKQKKPHDELNDSSEIYVISDTIHDQWNNLNLTVGPAIVEGLTNFNNVNFHLEDVSFQNFQNLPCFIDLSFKLQSHSLKGKTKWHYNYTQPEHYDASLTYSFTMDYFEIICSMKPVLDTDTGYTLVKTDMKISLGEIQIHMSELNKDKDEKNFVRVILSDHLKSLINKWLTKSVTDKILPKIEYFDCLTGSTKTTADSNEIHMGLTDY